MNNFTFYNPTKLVFGKDTIPQIGSHIASSNIKKVMLVSGGGSIKTNGVYEQTVASLREHNIEWIEFWGVRPNPTLDHVNAGIKLAKENNIEALLSVGGGSTIDTCKTMAAGFYLDDVWDVFEQKVTVKQALPLFVVLTLSATGSEMDAGAVISNTAENKKWSFFSPHVFPKVSIVDPSVQTSLPWNQTVNGAIDAMAHIQESYFFQLTQEATIAIDEALVRTIISVTDKLQTDPTDYSSRANLAWAATLALNGIPSAGFKPTEYSVHWLEHCISSMYPEVAHGAGLAVLYPGWIKFAQKYNPEQFRRWAKNIWDKGTVEEGSDALRAKFQAWGSPACLRDLKIDIPKFKEFVYHSKSQALGGRMDRFSNDDLSTIIDLCEK